MKIDVVVGIDIGGTFTKIGLVDQQGTVYHDDSIETDKYPEPEAFCKALKEKIDGYVTDHPKDLTIKGVGVGAPNGNYYSGNIEQAPNLDWKGIVPLADMLKKEFELPVAITNDANAAALGELLFGAAQGMKNFLMITLGTGLGSGLVVNGELVYGHDGFAGELGHVEIREKGRKCGCGKRGCLETYVSATGIKRTVFQLLASEVDNSCFRGMTFHDMVPKDISVAANNGDPIAIKAFQRTGAILGQSLANTVAHTSPEAIFLFGGLARAGKWIFEPTKEALEKHLLPIYLGKIDVLPSALLDKNIAVIGAAALIWKEIDN